MPRTAFECDPSAYYHITARSINRDWFNMEMEFVWEIMTNELYFVKHAFNLNVYAFVLMSNHYHLLVSAPQGNLSSAMAYFQKQTSRQIVKKANRINNLWAQRFKRTRLTNIDHLMNTYKYVYQNPVRAKLVTRCEFYRFSSLSGLIGQRHLIVPLEYDFIFFDTFREECLCWLNKPIEQQDVESMRVALKKTSFKYPNIRKRSNPLEGVLI